MEDGQNIRDYVLKSQIGAGGVGEVWRAYHNRLHKEVAIKFILPHLCRDLDIYQRFVREAVEVARLEHPHIISVYDFFPFDDNACLVMPYIKGGSLQDRIVRQGRIDLEEALYISRGILDALDHAHQQAVVHRDVKPSNILVTADSHPYLVDFGIALVLGKPRVTNHGTNIGTPEYMSPEQIRGEKLDHHSDVYSFGCVLYEMLTGHPPFGSVGEAGATDYTIMERHLKNAPQPIRNLNPTVNDQTEDVVRRALEKDINKRFAGCGQMMRALPAPVGFTAGGKVPVPKTHPVAQRASLVLKLAAGILALAAIITIGGWIGTFWQKRDLISKYRSKKLQKSSLSLANRQLHEQIDALKIKLARLKPISILDIKLYNADKRLNPIGAFAETFRKPDIRFLAFHVKLRNNAARKGQLGVKYIRPDGTVNRNQSTSPPGLSFSMEIDPKTGAYDRGWGTERGGTFARGRHYIQFWWNDKKVGEKAFFVK